MTAPLRLLALTLLALALAATPASGAAVEVRVVDRSGAVGYAHQEWRLVYTAAPGERNDVRLRSLDDWTIRVTDAGAPVAAGDRCRAIDERTAECEASSTFSPTTVAPYLSIAEVLAGDADDRVEVEGRRLPQLYANGGEGDDVLTGSEQGGDELNGGGGRDRLLGRGNSDVLSDGDTTGAADADVLDGGGEGDTVSYEGRTGDLVVDLGDGGTDGERGEGDVLLGIDHVVGGSGDDDIGGTAARNTLDGGAGDDHLDGEGDEDWLLGGSGRDRLHGHGADDRLEGGPGRDRLRGDAGDDAFPAATSLDVIRCGPGLDGIHNGRGPFARPGCEQLSFTFSDEPEDRGALIDSEGPSMTLDPHPVLSRTGRSLVVTFGCADVVGSGGVCGDSTGTLTVTTRRGRPVGRGKVIGRFRDEAGATETARVRVALGRRGRRRAAPGRAVRLALRGSHLPTAHWTARVRRAGR